MLVSTPARAGSIEEEAQRQADFARQELQEGHYDKALKSAESALRLHPALYEAMLLKALAYEGLGNLELAESLVRAYLELVGEAAAQPEAREHLQRIAEARTARTSQRVGGRTARERADRATDDEETGEAESEVEVVAVPPGDLDPTPYQQRVVAALAEGKCEAARAAATELTLAASDRAEGWKLAGDAARCASRSREAVLAYRRYQELGGADKAALRLLEALAGGLASLRVAVKTEAEHAVPALRLHTPEGQIVPAALSNGVFLFADLETGKPAVLEVAGRGFEAQDVEVAPLGSGQQLDIELSPVFLGLGSLTLLEHQASDATVTLFTPDDTLDAESGQTYTVTAGESLVRVQNEHGSLDVPLQVGPDASVAFDAAPVLPASLTVIGLPSGASVRLTAGASGRVQVVLDQEIDAGKGEIDPGTGVRIAPAWRFDSLAGGAGELAVTHPVLGAASVTLALEDGAVNAATFDHRSLPGVAGVRAAFEDYKLTHPAVAAPSSDGKPLRVISAMLAAAGAGLLVGSAVAGAEVGNAKTAGLEAGRDRDALRDAWLSSSRGAQAQIGLAIGGGVSMGIGAVGFGVSFGLPRVARAGAVDLDDWDPDAVEAAAP
jgi:tetratricopeptide (TPR) repeat protein